MVSTLALAALLLLLVAAGVIARNLWIGYVRPERRWELAFPIPFLVPLAAYTISAAATFVADWGPLTWLATTVRWPGTFLVGEVLRAERVVGWTALAALTWVLAGTFWTLAAVVAWLMIPPRRDTTWDNFQGTRMFTISAPEALQRYKDAVREIMTVEQVTMRVEPSIEIRAKIVALVAPGTPLADAHSPWIGRSAGEVDTPADFPRRDAQTPCPPGLLCVEVECIRRRSGGMGSVFGYDGYFVSFLMSLETRTIWDARGVKAS